MANLDTYDEKYSKWNIADLLIILSEYKYEVAKATKKQFIILKKLMNDKEIDTVINACDTGQQYFSIVYNINGSSMQTILSRRKTVLFGSLKPRVAKLADKIRTLTGRLRISSTLSKNMPEIRT